MRSEAEEATLAVAIDRGKKTGRTGCLFFGEISSGGHRIMLYHTRAWIASTCCVHALVERHFYKASPETVAGSCLCHSGSIL